MELKDTVEHDTFTVQCIIEDLQKENDSEIARDSTVNSRSEHEVNNDTSANMAVPSTSSSSVELQTLLVANMQQNSTMMKAIADTFTSLQKQRIANDNRPTDNKDCESTSKTSKRKSVDEPTSSSNNSVKKQKADDPTEKTGDDFDALVDESDGESETESGEEDSNDTDTLLNEIKECFGSDEKCGDSILDKLAKVTNDGLRTKLDGSKIKEATEKYLRPKNVENLKTPWVNNYSLFDYCLLGEIVFINSEVSFKPEVPNWEKKLNS